MRDRALTPSGRIKEMMAQKGRVPITQGRKEFLEERVHESWYQQLPFDLLPKEHKRGERTRRIQSMIQKFKMV